MKPIICPECQTVFTPKHPSAVTCSTNCRQRRYFGRLKASRAVLVGLVDAFDAGDESAVRARVNDARPLVA